MPLEQLTRWKAQGSLANTPPPPSPGSSLPPSLPRLPPCLCAAGPPQPELPALHRTLLSVLEQNCRQGALIQQLLVATEQSQEAAGRLQAQCRGLEAELAKQRQSAERASREAEMVAGVEVRAEEGRGAA